MHIRQYAIVTAESPVGSNSPVATRDVQGSCSVVRAPLPPKGLGAPFNGATWRLGDGPVGERPLRSHATCRFA